MNVFQILSHKQRTVGLNGPRVSQRSLISALAAHKHSRSVFRFPARFDRFTHLPHSFLAEKIIKVAEKFYNSIVAGEIVDFVSKPSHVLNDVELLATLGEVDHIFVLD